MLIKPDYEKTSNEGKCWFKLQLFYFLLQVSYCCYSINSFLIGLHGNRDYLWIRSEKSWRYVHWRITWLDFLLKLYSKVILEKLQNDQASSQVATFPWQFLQRFQDNPFETHTVDCIHIKLIMIYAPSSNKRHLF